jgi:hypothetical protein
MNVHDDEDEVVLDDALERLRARLRPHDPTPQRIEDGLQGEQIGLVVIDRQDRGRRLE